MKNEAVTTGVDKLIEAIIEYHIDAAVRFGSKAELVIAMTEYAVNEGIQPIDEYVWSETRRQLVNDDYAFIERMITAKQRIKEATSLLRGGRDGE